MCEKGNIGRREKGICKKASKCETERVRAGKTTLCQQKMAKNRTENANGDKHKNAQRNKAACEPNVHGSLRHVAYTKRAHHIGHSRGLLRVQQRQCIRERLQTLVEVQTKQSVLVHAFRHAQNSIKVLQAARERTNADNQTRIEMWLNVYSKKCKNVQMRTWQKQQQQSDKSNCDRTSKTVGIAHDAQANECTLAHTMRVDKPNALTACTVRTWGR